MTTELSNTDGLILFKNSFVIIIIIIIIIILKKLFFDSSLKSVIQLVLVRSTADILTPWNILTKTILEIQHSKWAFSFSFSMPAIIIY